MFVFVDEYLVVYEYVVVRVCTCAFNIYLHGYVRCNYAFAYVPKIPT